MTPAMLSSADDPPPSHDEGDPAKDRNAGHQSSTFSSHRVTTRDDLGGSNEMERSHRVEDTPASESTLITYPNLAHYIYDLLASISVSPTRASSLKAPSHHPLSVSSSGGSDEEDTHDDDEDTTIHQTPRKITQSIDPEAKDGLVRRIVVLLDQDEEEAVKDVLRPHMGDLANDDILMDQVCLDCMHKRRDDIENIPYAPAMTPNRLRGSPATGTIPLRPYTPNRVPSFRALTPVGRPHSPSTAYGLGIGASTSLSMPHNSSNLSRSSNDTSLSPSTANNGLSSSHSSSGSPSISPRILSAKAASFSPAPKSQSGGSRPSPSDPWKDLPVENARSSSPFGAIGPPSMTRTSSNLAIAAPLFNDQSSPFHSPIGTPSRAPLKMPDSFISPANLQRTSSASIIPDLDDDDDEFSPFGSYAKVQGNSDLSTQAKPFTPFASTGKERIDDLSPSSPYITMDQSSGLGTGESQGMDEEYDDPDLGMTPLDVLASVFSSVPRPDLEDALHRAGYDFEGAMGILVASHAHPRSGSSTPQRLASPRPMLSVGQRGTMPINQHAPRDGYFLQGGRSYSGNISPGFGAPRSPGGHATRMCRYFLAGECRRSDCRFSHDLDRALCRFWLRGHCAKGPNCEFLHQLPEGLDPSALSSAMARVELGSDGSAHHSPTGPHHRPPDDFPDLFAARIGRGHRFDPSRNRFANALKRPVPNNLPTTQITGMQSSMANRAGYFPSQPADSRLSTLAIPRPSYRIKLRPPTLLPTVRTGSQSNDQYLSARNAAIRLGQARNACLARAADAFRRGDGAAAKRFSREGKGLNERMLNEQTAASQTLIRARMEEARTAIMERTTSWTDDSADKTVRGRVCGGGLGLLLGVASSTVGPQMSADERTEAMMDLHTIHGEEGVHFASLFLDHLDAEHFRGLAYILVGEGKHVGTQDPLRGASKTRLAASVKQYLSEMGYAWNEFGGALCVDSHRR